jgi:dihydrolipoamide dehydrogenase
MANKTEPFDVAILGAGPGGYVAAIRAAQLGMNVAVIEREEVGGICLNWGCIPSKALIRNAEIFHLYNRGKEFGVKVTGLELDFSAVIKRSRQVSNRLVKGVEFLFRKNKVNLIKGSGKLTKDRTIEVSDANGKNTETVAAKNIIIATGARPRTIPGIQIDGKKIISSKEAMILDSIPKSMIIIGAGAIGVEFAYVYNAFGTKVTVIEMMPYILPFEDKEHSEILKKSLSKSGIDIHTDTRVKSIDTSSKKVSVTVSNQKGEEKFDGDVALMAIGVQGNVENIGLEEIGVQPEKSFIQVDKHYATQADGVYAIGDVIGAPLLAHVGSAEGIHAVEYIAGKNPKPIDYTNFPSCTYCIPQVASVGMTEEKAKEAGYELRIGRFPFRANGKSLAYGESEGQVKLIFDAKYGELLGAHIIGAEATELIAELGTAKTLETTFTEIHKTIHAHPTMTEAIMEAAAAADEGAIHI